MNLSNLFFLSRINFVISSFFDKTRISQTKTLFFIVLVQFISLNWNKLSSRSLKYLIKPNYGIQIKQKLFT